MGTMGYIFPLVILAILCPAINGHCDVNICNKIVDDMLKEPFICNQTMDDIIVALHPCREGCNSTVTKAVANLVGPKIEAASSAEGCPHSRQCVPTQAFECAMGAANLIIIFANIQLQNLTKFCIDGSDLTNTINVCQMCVTGLIPQVVSNPALETEINRIFGIAVTLVNGACNCSRMLVDLVNSIDTTSSCGLVTTVVNFARTIASDCAIQLVNLPLQIEWLQILDNYINFFLPFTATFCGIVTGAASSVTAGYFLYISVLFVFALKFLRS